MRYFSVEVNGKDIVRVLESDGSQDHLIQEDWVEITEELAIALTAISSEVTTVDVDQERDRRLLRFKYDGVWYQSRPMDRVRMAGAHSAALACMLTNTPWPEDFAWIAEDDSHIPMDLQSTLMFGNTALNHERLHIFAANALKKMDPIPEDFASDIWWPEVPT